MFFSFDIGDYLLHEKYGIGQFIGIEKLDINNTAMDFFKVEYLNDSFLLIPAYNIGVFRYHSSKNDETQIDVLGKSNVLKKQQKLKLEIAAEAEELKKIYQEREMIKVSAFSENVDYIKFCNDFPHELTKSQKKAMTDVLCDLSKTKPMDRLICGDVGFGKTEIAARSIALALSNNKKAIFIVPTTILASQHYSIFKERLSKIGKTCQLLSKLNHNPARVKLKWHKGEFDLLICTAHHKGVDGLLIDNLGLIVLDEEHHFGVKFKEKIRLKTHFLQLSATPIPRTLNLALSKIKDISILEMPPVGRKDIEVNFSTLKELDLETIIKTEIKNGGKIFLVVPRVHFIPEIEKLIPFAEYKILHGQLSKAEIQDALNNFVEGSVNILISTNIIESGMNILTANLMIIFHAHMFGVAQLHQLKGRVGRGDLQAKVYFVIPETLKEISMDRMNIIKNNASVGGGFSIAMHDMDFRGSGTIVGNKQSGKDYGFGLEMYYDILHECLNETKINRTELKIGWVGFSNAFIPEDYILDSKMRFSFYKKMSQVDSLKNLNLIKNDLLSFGNIPTELLTFLQIVMINLLAKYLLIQKVIKTESEFEVYYSDIDIDCFIIVQKIVLVDCPKRKIVFNESQLEKLIELFELQEQ